MVLPIIVPGADFKAFDWAHSPDVPTPARALKPACWQRPCAKIVLPMDEASKRERLVSRWRAIARSRPLLPLRPTSTKLALSHAVKDGATGSVDKGGNLLGGCEWLLRLTLRDQWAGLCHVERVQVHAVVDHFPWQSPVFEVATITVNAAAWMLFAMYWSGSSHPASLFQKPLHPPTGLVRWVSGFRLEQQTTQADDIQRRLASDLRVAAHQCGLLVRRMAMKAGQVALLREICDF
jgi:hypothetical protein